MSIFDSTNFERQGNTEHDIYLDNISDIHESIIKISSTALRTIKIFTPDLQPELYNTDNFRKSLLDFSRGNRHAKIQILTACLSNTTGQQGHQLIRLAQQIPSVVQIRNTPEDYQNIDIAFILADHSCFVLKRTNPGADSLHSTCKYRINKLIEFFTATWEQAEKSTQTQQFHI